MGVKRVSIPSHDTECRARKQRQKQRGFKKLQRWRTGCEGRISFLKRRHGLRRSLYKGPDGSRRWVGLGMPSFRTPPSGFGISTRFTGCGLKVPLNNCSRIAGQCCIRYPGSSWTVMPSTPGLPLLALTRLNACLQFSRPQTSSINCSVMAGLSVPRFPADDSVPSGRPFGASPLSSSMKANSSWFFCRLSPMSRAGYSPLPLPPRAVEHARHTTKGEPV